MDDFDYPAGVLRRLWHQLKFEIEGFLLRGPHTRLLLIAMLLGAISSAGGFLVYYFSDQFNDGGAAVWWAFLRLTDPGYLGDDEGTFVRTVSTILTVLGYVLFLGALVAIMTQWLNQTLERLQSGLTPIAEANHIVILGWNNRVVTVVQELLLSEERVRRFLRAHREGKLRIAILAEEVNPPLLQELRDQLGELFDPRQIILRSGTPLRIEHLRRVDYSHAAAILFPRSDTRSGAGESDERMLKTLLSISSGVDDQEELPLLVAELGDSGKLEIARRAYRGRIEVIGADRMFARLVVQTLRSPGMSRIFGELLTHRTGTEIYVRAVPELEGESWASVIQRFDRAVPFGVVRTGGESHAVLFPDDDYEIVANDRIAAIAPNWSAAAPGEPGEAPAVAPVNGILPQAADPGRILILGWNEKAGAVLSELSMIPSRELVHVDIVSTRPAAERTARLEKMGVEGSRIHVRQLELSATAPADVIGLSPDEYDHVILLASDRFDEEDESDARTLVSALVLEEALRGRRRRPHIVIELLDPDNEPLVRGADREILVSPLLLGHVMTQVALRPELRVVFDELFGIGGTSMEFHSLAAVGVGAGAHDFATLSSIVRAHGGILVGWRRGGELELNPARDARVTLDSSDALVILRQSSGG